MFFSFLEMHYYLNTYGCVGEKYLSGTPVYGPLVFAIDGTCDHVFEIPEDVTITPRVVVGTPSTGQWRKYNATGWKTFAWCYPAPKGRT